MATEIKALEPKFYIHPEFGPVCETKIGPQAGADTVIQKVTAEHAALHPAEYARFVSGGGLVKPEGQDIRKIPGVDDTLASVLAVHGIATVEAFAKLGDTAAAAIMPQNSIRAIELRDVARLVAGIKPASSSLQDPDPVTVGSAPVPQASVLDEASVKKMLDEQRAGFEGQMQRMQAQLNAANAALEGASPMVKYHDQADDADVTQTPTARAPGRPRRAG